VFAVTDWVMFLSRAFSGIFENLPKANQNITDFLLRVFCGTNVSIRFFFKVSLWWPQEIFKRPQIFQIMT